MDKIDRLFDLCHDTLVQYVSDYSRIIISSQVEHIMGIRNQLKMIEKEIHLLSRQFIEYALLMTITGCDPVTAATIIAETGNILRFMNADHYVSYSGSLPKNKRSGTSVDTRGKISKKGSKYLRNALFMIAEFARRHNLVLK